MEKINKQFIEMLSGIKPGIEVEYEASNQDPYLIIHKETQTRIRVKKNEKGKIICAVKPHIYRKDMNTLLHNLQNWTKPVSIQDVLKITEALGELESMLSKTFGEYYQSNNYLSNDYFDRARLTYEGFMFE